MRDRSVRSGRKLAREIQLTDWSTAGNLSNRSSGVQIPRDICTRFGRYLYSTKCSWIIKYSKSPSPCLFLELLVYFLLFTLTSFLSQEVFVIVMEELTGHVTHFNTIDYAPEVWDQDDIKVIYRVTFPKEGLLSNSKGDGTPLADPHGTFLQCAFAGYCWFSHVRIKVNKIPWLH